MKDYLSILRAAIGKKLADDPGRNQMRLAKQFGLSQSQVSKILTGRIASASKLEMIAEGLDVTLADLVAQAREQPETIMLVPVGEAPVIGANHLAAQPMIRNRIQDAVQRSYETNISVLGVALRYSWRFLESEIPDILSPFEETRRVNISLGMVAPKILGNRHLKRWEEEAEKVRGEIEAFLSAEPDPRITVTLFIYENLPHWHGLLIDSSELFLGRTRWNQASVGTGTSKQIVWQLSVGQEPYRLYSADKPGGFERIRMFMSWFDWYRFSGEQLLTNRKVEENDDVHGRSSDELGHDPADTGD